MPDQTIDEQLQDVRHHALSVVSEDDRLLRVAILLARLASICRQQQRTIDRLTGDDR